MIASIAIGCTQPKVQNNTKITDSSKTDSDGNFVSETLSTILKQLNLKPEDCYSNFISEMPMPGNERLTIWIIPKITLYEKDNYGNEIFNLDSYVLLADTETGKIVSKYHFPDKWSSDAYEITGISIDSLDYRLNDDKIVFGVSRSSKASTRVCPTGDGFTELFVQQGDSLHCIFGYSTYNYHGENYGGLNGNAWMEEYRTKLIVLENKTNGFYNFSLLTYYESEATENNKVVSTDASSDSLLFFNYKEDGYKETKNHIKVFCKPLEYGKKDCNYYGKTLAEVYQIIYEGNKNDNQRYMRRELPLKDSDYTMIHDGQTEEIDSINISYNYINRKHLSVSLETEGGCEYYTFEEMDNYTRFRYDYHD